MRNSKTIPFFTILFLIVVQCKKVPADFNILSAPDNWRKETIAFPLSFAQSLDHKGTEYVRFAPGWGKQGSDEYFSYSFLWYLENDPQLSSSNLESQLAVYFDGLMQEFSTTNASRAAAIPKTTAFFEKINNHTYAGKVLTYDAFITKKELNLNIVATYMYCKKTDRHIIQFKISPQPIAHAVWNKLNEVIINIDCI
ncbi:hypothetical protein ACWGOQ_0008605 [Aquimarina sp. M1]